MITIDDVEYILAKVKEHKLPFLGIKLGAVPSVSFNILDDKIGEHLSIDFLELSQLEEELIEFKNRLRQKVQVELEHTREQMSKQTKHYEYSMLFLSKRIQELEALIF